MRIRSQAVNDEKISAPIDRLLGQRVREEREARGLSIRQLAGAMAEAGKPLRACICMQIRLRSAPCPRPPDSPPPSRPCAGRGQDVNLHPCTVVQW